MVAQSSAIFITAAEARQNPLRERVIHDEARGIESAILDAVRLGLYEATVSDGTPMTSSSPLVSEAWTINASTDQLLVPSHGFSTGDAVVLSSTQALPAPLRAGTYYYVIYVDADHIKLADSYSSAVAGRPVGIDITSGVIAIDVTEQGSGYIQPPVVSVTGGGATAQATARAILAPWASVISISNTGSGSGYNDRPTVQIVPQGSGASWASVNYCIVGISVSSAGNDYRVGDILSVSGGSGTAATATVSQVSPTGQVLSLQISNAGNYSILPSLVSAATTVLPGGGSGATVNLTAGIRSVALSSGGNGYTAPPRIRIIDPSGIGAEASAVLTGGSITGITVSNPGYGYVGVSDVEFDSGAGASAVASLVPSSVAAIVMTDQGSGYTTPPNVTIDPIGGGCLVDSIRMKIVGVQLTNAGRGYQKDDILLISGGVASLNAYLRVTSVTSNGSILTFVLEEGGSYSTLPGLVSNPVNGGSGTLAAFNCVAGVGEVTLLDPGSNYVVPPVISVSAPTGSSARTAVVQAVLDDDLVASFRVLDSGQGYTSVPSITISNGSGAEGVALLVPTSLASISMQNTGSGYTTANIIISGGGATIDATAVAVITGTSITGIDLIDPGEGYTSTPTVTIDGDGIGAAAQAHLSPTGISGIEVTDGGTGYNIPPAVNIDGNATAVSLLTATGIDRIVVTDQGQNYTADPTIFLIPGPNQTPTPLPPPLAVQRGFSVASVVVVSSGGSYSSVPSVALGQPQISGGIPATANASIGAGSGTFAIQSYPSSRDYFKVWKGQSPSNSQLVRPYEDQMNTVISYFTNLGYTINRLTNTSTNATMTWKVQW